MLPPTPQSVALALAPPPPPKKTKLRRESRSTRIAGLLQCNVVMTL